MPVSNIAIVLIIVLAIVVALLFKKSIARHNDNSSSISNLKHEFNKRSDSIDSKYKEIKASIGSLYSDKFEQAKKTQSFEDSITDLGKRIETLTSRLDLLTKENIELRQELDKQKKQLHFFTHIEEAAKNLTITEDIPKRDRALDSAKKKIISGQNVQNTIDSEKKEKIDVVETEDEGLDEEQEFARNYMENTNENVFVTGKAGTGKSFLLDAFMVTTGKNPIVLAPTGIAALNVKGATIHSVFGGDNLKLDVEDISDSTIKIKDELWYLLEQVNTIIIDEISMVRADTFEKIDRILKIINRSEKPFGGKQMIVFGDLFQLPPIASKEEQEYLQDKFGGIFFFHSNAYKNGRFKFIELTHNHRQKEDAVFFEILNRIREGAPTKDDIARLNTKYNPNESVYDRYIAIFPNKEDAAQENKNHLSQIDSTQFIYEAKIILDKKAGRIINDDFIKSVEKNFPFNFKLSLKLGATVMMVANDPEKRWVNGTVGIVKELSKDRIIVSFDEGKNFEIHPKEFEQQKIRYKNGKISYETVLSIMQYPVVPAYAITIHKSQGQTYKNVTCDVKKCFADGQAYVALSRCSSLEGLHLKNRVTPASIRVNREVLEFYQHQVANNLLN